MIEFEPQDGVRFIKNVMIEMEDGVRVALDMHVPDDGAGDWRVQAQPLLLEYIPYRKDDNAPYSGHHHRLAQNGIIGARLDCRGSGSSEGVAFDEYTEREQRDGYEAIEWLAEQPWCSGRIGMIGISYGGFTAVQVAALAPPHLVTIIPVDFTDDRYTDDCHYRGGAMRCYYDIGAYGASMIGMNAMPPYPEYSGLDWAKVWEEHLENNTPYMLKWMAHPTDGPYWRPGSIRGRYDDIKASVFMIGGWRDGYPNPPLRTFNNLSVPKRLLMGPWNHAFPDIALPGPCIDYLDEVVRWCDHWLKGEDNGVMDAPSVQIYMQGYDEPRADRTRTSGYWRAEKDLSATTAQTWWLACEGCLCNDAPAGIAEGEGDFDEHVYDATVGTCGGLWSGGVPFGLPTDQRPDEAYSLTYTSAVLTTPMEILGWPRVELHVSSTAPVMCFVVRLCDVAPDGTSALICTGVLNGTRRQSLEEPVAMVPDTIYKLDIELDATAWRFEPGHRLRLSVAGADFPNLWPTPYAGTNRVFHGVMHPSRLLLPTVEVRATADGERFPPDELDLPPAQEPEPYALAPDEPVWQIVRDVMNQRTALKMLQRKTQNSHAGMEVTNERDLEIWASAREPAEVSARGRHWRRIVRRDGTMIIDSMCSVRSTVDAFHCTIDLSVTVNELPHYQRRWVESFPRQLL
jgi:putative CocE/NonD family hydrolase